MYLSKDFISIFPKGEFTGILSFEKDYRDLPGGPMVKGPCSQCTGLTSVPVGELRSCMLKWYGLKKKKKGEG